MENLRDVAITVTSVLAMIGALGTAAAVSWKTMQWATTQVDRARKVTALVSEVPKLAAELTKVSFILTNLVDRVDILAKAHTAETENARAAQVDV